MMSFGLCPLLVLLSCSWLHSQAHSWPPAVPGSCQSCQGLWQKTPAAPDSPSENPRRDCCVSVPEPFTGARRWSRLMGPALVTWSRLTMPHAGPQAGSEPSVLPTPGILAGAAGPHMPGARAPEPPGWPHGKCCWRFLEKGVNLEDGVGFPVRDPPTRDGRPADPDAPGLKAEGCRCPEPWLYLVPGAQDSVLF